MYAVSHKATVPAFHRRSYALNSVFGGDEDDPTNTGDGDISSGGCEDNEPSAVEAVGQW
jgi:hypothetical protein